MEIIKMKDEELYKKEELNSQKINIDVLPLLANLYKKKIWVIIATLIFGAIGTFFAYTADREYTASEVVVPEQEQDMKSSLMNSLSNFMDLTSATGSEEGAYNVTIFPEMGTSKPFLASLLKVQVVPSEKSKIKLKKNQKSITLYDYLTDPIRTTTSEKIIGGIKTALHLEKIEPKGDINKIDITHYTKQQEGLLKGLEKNVDIVINKKTGITTISFTADDPAIAQQMADTISCKLQEMVINYKTLKAKEKLKYYTKISDEARLRLIKLQKKYAAAADENFFVELQSIKSNIDRIEQDAILAQDAYNTIEKQRISALMEVQDAKPVFVVLEPASYPNKANSGRAIKVILYAFIGFILSSIIAMFGGKISNNFKKNWKVIKEGNV